MTSTQVDLERIAPSFKVGHRMELALQVAGIPKGDMAERLGINRNTLTRWIDGSTPVKRFVLVAWAEETGVDLGWLETGVYAMRDLNPQPADLESRSAWVLAA